uniref:Centrosomal protein CCDC61 n=1 Tax=Otus sunia TaxID=257818 RepID=A0A8C8AG61_9STRI
MEEPRYVQADCSFGLGAHTVRLALARSALAVEVEAARTAERWRGDFDAAFIEDLTHKTGNFKQFGIFCSMLESALRRSSASVSLDLLTYADLQTLRTRRTGASARPPPAAPSPLGTKRYLLLVYSVEFDRIHYPLPLPYAGGPDPAALLRELREELAQLRARRDAEIQHLQDKCREGGVLVALGELLVALGGLLVALGGPPVAQLPPCLRGAAGGDEGGGAAAAAAGDEPDSRAGRLQEGVRLRWGARGGPSEVWGVPLSSPLPPPSPPQERRSGSAPRSASRESRSGSQGRPPPRSPSPAEGGGGHSLPPPHPNTPFPSPPGSRPPRFDPTAFVRARQRRQELKKSVVAP